ncbi:uncharacterized protein LOC142558359 [Dermacentor variabilis]|uniref:uncharacterized protein LOC142558359 n=1 Tax=Dermacentor variabilis TaxID=34621 RepID=UPI003F5B5A15
MTPMTVTLRGGSLSTTEMNHASTRLPSISSWKWTAMESPVFFPMQEHIQATINKSILTTNMSHGGLQASNSEGSSLTSSSNVRGLLEGSYSRGAKPASSEMLPRFPSSGLSQAMPPPAPWTNQCNNSFHQPASPMAAGIRGGDSGTAASSTTGSPYQHLHHRQVFMPASDSHQSINVTSYDLCSASTSATTRGFAHSASVAESGLQLPQDFQQPGMSSHHMTTPSHASTATPSKALACSETAIATQQAMMPSPVIQELHICELPAHDPHTYLPSLATLFHHEAMLHFATTHIQPTKSAHEQPIDISSQQQSGPSSMISQQQDGVSGQTSQCNQQQLHQQQYQIQMPGVLSVKQMQHTDCDNTMEQQRIQSTHSQSVNDHNITPPMSSDYQMMAPQSHLHSSRVCGGCAVGLHANVKPIFGLYRLNELPLVPDSLLHHQQQRFDTSTNSMTQQNFSPLQEQTASPSPEASTEQSDADGATPEAGVGPGAETADANEALQRNDSRPADEMDSVSSRLRNLVCTIPSLDSARLLARFQTLLNKLKTRGADLHKPCGNIVGSTTCWTTGQLASLNEVLRTVNVQVFEHVPSAFTLKCLRDPSEDKPITVSSIVEPCCLVYWLLRYHICIERLVLDFEAVILRYFPAALTEALPANKGLVEIQGQSRGRYLYEKSSCAVLARVICEMSPRLECLHVTPLELDRAAVDSLVQGIRSPSNLRHLVLGDMSEKLARKVFGAIAASQSLSSLEMSSDERFTQAHSALLAAALKGNTTLRYLAVRHLEHDTVGIIIGSLASNDALKELSLEDSRYRARYSLPDGLRAFHVNKTLRCLKLTDVGFTTKCALVLADVLRWNDALEEVFLRRNPIKCVGAAALAKVLGRNTSIKLLDLTQGKFQSHAVSRFVEALSRNRTVECVRLGNVPLDECWKPPLPLTADVFARLQVAWNPRVLKQWASCLQREHRYCPSACVRWNDREYTKPITQWLSAMHASRSSLSELVVYMSFYAGFTDVVEALVRFLEDTRSLKKLVFRPFGDSDTCPSEIIACMARNKSLREAEFDVAIGKYREVKAVQAVLKANRTLHRLKFLVNELPQQAPRMLARSLEGNFVFLTLEFDKCKTKADMYPLLSALNRNRTPLISAVRHVLYGTVDDCSMRALRLLSSSDSLLDALVSASGKTRDQCKCLILDAVNHAGSCPSAM